MATLMNPSESTNEPIKPVGNWLMRMVWHDLLFMHWKVDVAALRKMIPERLGIDTFDGEAWIGIVPFRMTGVSLRLVPDFPWLSRFPELNVRTYVIGPDGKRGVWFFSLDATNPIAVRGARWLYHLKYVDAKISLHKGSGSDCGQWIKYKSTRTHRGEFPAKLKVEYRPIGESFEAQSGSLDHWLTARYALYTASPAGQIFQGDIEHDPWTLRNAQAILHENSMTGGLGIELPDEPPILHFAQTTKVVAWPLRKI